MARPAQVMLAKEAREQAIIAIEKDPNSDLAHHLMGRWGILGALKTTAASLNF
jgi:hypothetical protein